MLTFKRRAEWVNEHTRRYERPVIQAFTVDTKNEELFKKILLPGKCQIDEYIFDPIKVMDELENLITTRDKYMKEPNSPLKERTLEVLNILIRPLERLETEFLRLEEQQQSLAGRLRRYLFGNGKLYINQTPPNEAVQVNIRINLRETPPSQ